MSTIKGDLNVCRTVNAGRRVNQGLLAKTITATEQLELNSEWWQKLTAAAAQDVILPDATTLPNGWTVIVEAITSSLDVHTYDDTTPVSRKVIEAGRVYSFTLTDNGTDAGTWHVNFLEEADTLATSRYTSTFDATTSWGSASGGYYTITLPQATHTRGVSPQVDTFEESGSDYIQVEGDELKILANGNVELRVPETPDCRFAGKMVLI